MKPEEALKMVDDICSQVNLNRKAHAQLERAIAILAYTIKPKDKKKET